MFAVACLCSWYRYRQNHVRSECAVVYGRWRLLNKENSVFFLPSGKPIEMDLTAETCTIDPFHDPKWIDFHWQNLAGKPEKAIYRLESDRLRIIQVSPGAARPKSFDDKEPHPEGNVPARATLGLAEGVWERVPESEQ
jgi:uncharacterized protein (TIGR03067 family)